MKKYFSWCLLFFYLCGILQPSFAMVSFYLNQDDIARYKCVNKKKIEFDCHGKCFLTKEIEEKEEPEPAEVKSLDFMAPHLLKENNLNLAPDEKTDLHQGLTQAGTYFPIPLPHAPS